jgi:hypothetical protein
VISEACKEGIIKSYIRAYDGGEPIEKPWFFWNMESAWARFETCQVNASDEYSTRAAGPTAHWFFFDREAFEGFCIDRGKSIASSPIIIEDKEELSRFRPRGRPRGSQIDYLAGEFARMLAAGKISSETSDRDIARRLSDYAAEIWENPHDEGYIRERVSLWRQIPAASADNLPPLGRELTASFLYSIA